MSTAKFYVTGENMRWFHVRIQEEIQAQGLEGNAITAGRNTTAVIVEGDKETIQTLYKNLMELGPKTVKFSEITFGEFEVSDKTSRDMMITNGMDVLIAILEKIEENTREMNRKLDELSGKKTDTTVSTEATNSFSSLFGNE
jgi:hypothetical protein